MKRFKVDCFNDEHCTQFANTEYIYSDNIEDVKSSLYRFFKVEEDIELSVDAIFSSRMRYIIDDGYGCDTYGYSGLMFVTAKSYKEATKKLYEKGKIKRYKGYLDRVCKDIRSPLDILLSL